VGTTALIIPCSIAILIARALTKILAGDTVDEFQIHVKDLFFLEVGLDNPSHCLILTGDLCVPPRVSQSDVPLTMSGGTCADLIDTSAPQLKLRMSPLGVAAVLERNSRRGTFSRTPFEFLRVPFAHSQFLLGDPHVSFPVVSDSGHLHGMVSQLVLRKALTNKRGRTRKASQFAEVVMLVINAQRAKAARASTPRAEPGIRATLSRAGSSAKLGLDRAASWASPSKRLSRRPSA
jgi:hypothetical protein